MSVINFPGFNKHLNTYTKSQIGNDVRVYYSPVWARTRDSDLLARVEADLSKVAVRAQVDTVAEENRLRLTEITIDSNCASLNRNVTSS